MPSLLTKSTSAVAESPWAAWGRERGGCSTQVSSAWRSAVLLHAPAGCNHLVAVCNKAAVHTQSHNCYKYTRTSSSCTVQL